MTSTTYPSVQSIHHFFSQDFAAPDHYIGFYKRTFQDFLGYIITQTTMDYTHVLDNGPLGVKSPGDSL